MVAEVAFGHRQARIASERGAKLLLGLGVAALLREHDALVVARRRVAGMKADGLGVVRRRLARGVRRSASASPRLLWAKKLRSVTATARSKSVMLSRQYETCRRRQQRRHDEARDAAAARERTGSGARA